MTMQMLLARRRMMMQQGGGTPYDALLQYVTTTGAQQIITDLVVPSDSTVVKVETEMQDTSTAGVSRSIVMSGAAGEAAALQLYANVNRYYIQTSWLQKTTSFGVLTVTRDGANNTNNIKLGASNLNGTDNGRAIGGQSIVLFSTYANTYPSNYQSFKYVKIYFDDVLVGDFVPVRVGSVAQMYDQVANKLWQSQTGTDLVAGPDVV